jgi:membrane protein
MELLRDVLRGWKEDKASSLGAALAYYGTFSIAPLLVIFLALAGALFGEQAASGQLFHQVRDTLGDATAGALETLVTGAAQHQHGRWAAVIGIFVVLIGATSVFVELQDALNTVWKVAPRPGRGIRGIIRDRLLSFVMIVGTGLVLLAMLAVTTVLAAARETLAQLPGGSALWQWANAAISFLVVMVLFAIIFKELPDARIRWRDVVIGAVISACLFVAGKYAIGLYLAYSSVASIYGAAGSLVIVLIWVYYSAQVFLLGAEFSRAVAIRYGRGIEPADNAVRLERPLLLEPSSANNR